MGAATGSGWTAPTMPELDGPIVGADRAILEGYLAWQRRTMLEKCAGLSGEQLAMRTVPPSNLSLLGLLRHMAKVERIWFRLRIGQEQIPPLYPEYVDEDFVDLDPARAEREHTQLVEECRLADAAASRRSFDDTIVARDEVMSLRMVYVHMIGEYARHIGHADLIRERLDGATG